MNQLDVRGRVTMLDDVEDVIGACLLKMGFSFDSTDATQLASAREQAIQIMRRCSRHLMQRPRPK